MLCSVNLNINTIILPTTYVDRFTSKYIVVKFNELSERNGDRAT